MSAIVYYMALVRTPTGRIFRRTHQAPLCFHACTLLMLQDWCNFPAGQVADQSPRQSIGWREMAPVTVDLAGQEGEQATREPCDFAAMTWAEL